MKKTGQKYIKNTLYYILCLQNDGFCPPRKNTVFNRWYILSKKADFSVLRTKNILSKLRFNYKIFLNFVLKIFFVKIADKTKQFCVILAKLIENIKNNYAKTA